MCGIITAVVNDDLLGPLTSVIDPGSRSRRQRARLIGTCPEKVTRVRWAPGQPAR